MGHLRFEGNRRQHLRVGVIQLRLRLTGLGQRRQYRWNGAVIDFGYRAGGIHSLWDIIRYRRDSADADIGRERGFPAFKGRLILQERGLRAFHAGIGLHNVR